MATAASTLMRDILFFIKNDLSNNVTDPISSTRPTKGKFVMTSYPERPVDYPIITIRITNVQAQRAGMQTSNMDYQISVEIRIWARNEKEKDTLFNDVLERLRTIQYTSSTGSVANDLHELNALSALEVDEDGEGKPKSRVLEVTYKFYN